jgi:DNA-3-methyladenine glycosylase II
LQPGLIFTPMFPVFTKDNFQLLCRKLARKDGDLAAIIKTHQYPPMWVRPQKFSTLVLAILEQQVSLAAAYAAYKKLKEKTRLITPGNILSLTDTELRACYFSRQKIIYVRDLALAIQNKTLQLAKLAALPDDAVRTQLTKIKGIGTWTADVYLMHALRRTDVFPLGDLALVNSIKEIKQLPPHTTKEHLLELGEAYRPYRTIASMIYWHAYIKKRNIKLQG